jgi:vitamin B12 transporter
MSGTIARAQVAPSTSETIVVTGTRLFGTVSDDAGNVTIITRHDIEARHPSSAVELLRTLPGVYIEQPGGRGSVASIFIRGSKPNFTVVLIDGVRVNDQTNTRGGSFDFSTLSLDSIDRIEIVRGPESAIYGSDAVGGVINIITAKASHRLSADLDAAGGQFRFWRSAAGVQGPLPFGAMDASFGVSRTDNGNPVPGSVFRGTALNGSLAGSLFQTATFEITGRYGSDRAESFPDSSGGPLLAILRDVDRREINEAVVGARIDQRTSSNWAQSLQFGLYNRGSTTTSPGVAPSMQDPFGIPSSMDDVHFRSDDITWTNVVAPNRDLRLALGAELRVEKGRDNGSLQFGPLSLPTSFELKRTTWAGFAEASYQVLPATTLSAAERYDAATNAASRYDPKLGISYEITAIGTQLQLSWGRGFKVPSFYALGNPLVGDPTLKPESSTNIEGGITQRLVAVPGSVKFSWFSTHYTNLIDFNPGPVPKLVNLSEVHVRGGEASLDLHIAGNWVLGPYLSYTLTRNDSTGASLRDVPRWLVGGVLQWHPIEPVNTSLSVSHVGSYTDNAVPTGDVVLAGHNRVDLSTTWTLRPQQRLYLAAENLLNSHYEEAVGFPAPGLFVRCGMQILF